MAVEAAEQEHHQKVSCEPTLKQRTMGNKGMLRTGEVNFPRYELPNWLSSTK